MIGRPVTISFEASQLTIDSTQITAYLVNPTTVFIQSFSMFSFLTVKNKTCLCGGGNQSLCVGCYI